MSNRTHKQAANSLPECHIATGLAAELGCEDGARYLLQAGGKVLPSQLFLDTDLERGSLALPGKSLQHLLMPDGVRTNIAPQDNKLRLGPVVGVFVNRGIISRLAQGRGVFRNVQLANANRQAKCVLFFFTIKGISWSSRQITGYYYDYVENRWKQGVFPFPDVIYDRGGGFLRNQRPAAKHIRKQFKQIPDIQLFNAQHYFDKWDLYQKLSRHAIMQPHLPETILYTKQTDLAQMLNKYGCIYIKSLTGSNGRQVMRVIAENGHFRYNYFRGKIVDRVCPDLSSLKVAIRKFLGHRKLILQEGIKVLKTHGSSVDIRVLAGRDTLGKWQITDMPVRVANKGCAVTSTKSGSKVYRFDDAFRSIFAYSGKQINELRGKIAKTIMFTIQAIEKEYGRFGEVGIDVGVDTDGKVWIIEANSKPAKDTIRLSGDKDKLRTAFLLPLQYCKFLGGCSFESGPAAEVSIRSLDRKTNKNPAK